MKHKVFNTQDQAQAYADQETAKLPRGPLDITRLWDIPKKLKNGKFAIVLPDKDKDPKDVEELEDKDFDRPPPPQKGS